MKNTSECSRTSNIDLTVPKDREPLMSRLSTLVLTALTLLALLVAFGLQS